MKAAFDTIVGLIFDDWWLGIGLLVSIGISYFAITHGMDDRIVGWLLSLLIVVTLILSLVMEYRRKFKVSS